MARSEGGMVWLAGLILTVTSPMAAAQASPGVCFRSPEDVVQSGKLSEVRDTGYRLQSIHWDAQLGRNWATVASCEHPERPAVTLATLVKSAVVTSADSTLSQARALLTPVVRAGESVLVFRKEEWTQMEFSGIAQSNGNPGDRIRVRISHAASVEQTADQYFFAVVRGPRLLEMQP